MKKLFAGVTLTLCLLFAPSATAMPKYKPVCLFSGCGGISEDGSRAIFTFDEPLDSIPGVSPGDQIYQRFQGQTTGIIQFPEGKRREVRLHAVSDDARRAIVQTRSPLTADDTDGFGDDYFEITDGRARLISWDPAQPETASSANLNLQFMRASDDARTVYFTKVVKQGTCLQVWARTATAMTRVPNECHNWIISGLSRDGASIFLPGSEHGPGNEADSIFRLQGGKRTLMNGFPKSPDTNCSAISEFGDVSADGETLLFTANHPASLLDSDFETDVYLRHPDGSYELVTETPATAGHTGCGPVQGFEQDKALGLSSDGSKALFTTQHQLSDNDRDHSLDAYVYTSGGTAELVTTGPTDDQSETRNPSFGDNMAGWPTLAWRIDASDDLSVIAFDTTQRLTAADTDDAIDVYIRSGGQTRLVSTGPAGQNRNIDAKLLGISNDGSHVAFTTRERLLDVDNDNRMDIYDRTIAQDDGPVPASASGGATASVSAVRRRARTRLISAESVAPRMKIKGRARLVSTRRVALRLTCPKTEQTGPCRGQVTLRATGRKGKAGTARFRIKAGKTRKVTIRLPFRSVAGDWKAKLRLIASDRLGNTHRSNHRITVHP